MSDAQQVVEAWYAALANGDVDQVIGTFHPDLEASVVGQTPVSGRFSGRDEFIAGTLGVVFAALDPEQTRFAEQWSIFASEDNRVTGLMTGNAMAKSGRPYDGVYCQLFTVEGSQIIRYVEFVDTVLVESALFDNPLTRPSELQREPLRIEAAAAALSAPDTKASR